MTKGREYLRNCLESSPSPKTLCLWLQNFASTSSCRGMLRSLCFSPKNLHFRARYREIRDSFLHNAKPRLTRFFQIPKQLNPKPKNPFWWGANFHKNTEFTLFCSVHVFVFLCPKSLTFRTWYSPVFLLIHIKVLFGERRWNAQNRIPIRIYTNHFDCRMYGHRSL